MDPLRRSGIRFRSSPGQRIGGRYCFGRGIVQGARRLVRRTDPEIRSQGHGTVKGSTDRVVTGERLGPQLHGQIDANHVAVLPDSADRQIRSRIGNGFERAPVDLYSGVARRPARNSNVDRAGFGVRRFHFEGCALLPRELRYLFDPETLLLPVERGCQELVDIDVAAAVEVDGVGKLGEFLSAGPGAAQEGLLGRVVGTPVASRKRDKVLLESLRILSP